jgi:chaperonin GroEL
MEKDILKAIKELSDLVGRTMGPAGLPILIERKGIQLNGEPLTPMITKDGVTVAQNTSHYDEGLDLVIQTVKAIASKTNRSAGDGTTTATVLGYSILKAAFELMNKDKSLNPQIVRVELEKSVERVLLRLAEISREISGFEDIKNVATISANGEEDIGEIIAQAFDEVGNEGVITIDEGATHENTLEIVEGFQIGRGAQAQDRFFNDQNNSRWEAENVQVILYDGKLNSYVELIPAFKLLVETHKALPPILVVANEFSQQVIQFLLMQRAEAGATICAVRSPSMTVTRTNIMEDLAIVLGGERLGTGTRTVSNIKEGDFGLAKRVVVTGTNATFYEGQGLEEDLFSRVEQLKAQKETAPSEYDKANISDRIAALAQGIAKIGVGGRTELEVKERYHRIEDALNAAKAAVEGGVIPGGGITLYRIAQELSKSENVGDKILEKALKAPMIKILENSGKSFKQVLKSAIEKENIVYDARNHEWVDAYEKGIIDPVNVTKSALINAASIATLLATCGGGIVIRRPKNLISEAFLQLINWISNLDYKYIYLGLILLTLHAFSVL